MGADPYSVQDDLEKLFDAIHKVEFDEINRKNIKNIRSIMGGTEEWVDLLDPVVCEGNIEDWLLKLEKEMQRSVKYVCSKGAQECIGAEKDIQTFATKFQSQIALLGIQIIWTQRVEEVLERS
jgi:dynein heavy chain